MAVDTRTAVAAYISEGWSVLPIPNGEKGPRIADWQKATFDESHFKHDDNIGVHLGERSHWLTDVDLDAQEAILAARSLLIKSQRIHGRPSKPDSHHWFICLNSKSEQFKDVDGSVLAEIRSTGGQTVLPPSVHPSGERLDWSTSRPPLSIDAPTLRDSVRTVCIAAILARHWPSQGSRHEVAGLAAGMLSGLRLPPLVVEEIIKAAATIAGDEHLEDRVRYARDTAEKFQAGSKTGGGPKLADLLGEDLVKRIRSWFDVATSKIDELNERHAVIFQQSGDLIVITEDRDVDNRPFLRFSDTNTITKLYPQPVVVGTSPNGRPIVKPLGTAWLSSPRRRMYQGIELAPGDKVTPGYYNMWRGFAVEPAKGDWSFFENHVREVICSGDEDITTYVLDWMAQAVQDPGRPANTAIALRGGQGTGKGAFVRGFGSLFGVHFVHLDSTRQLTGNFNAHLHNAILVFADEAAWPGDKAGLGALKRLITEPTLTIERKGLDIMTVQNMIHLLLASNEEWTVPAALDERRFVVLDVHNNRQNDTKYFASLEERMRLGGAAALLHALLARKITVNLRQIPQTKALFEQKRLTASPQRQWWMEVLQDGSAWKTDSELHTPHGEPEYKVWRDELYSRYVELMEKSSRRFTVPGLATELGRFLRKVMPEGYPRNFRAADGRRAWVIPSMETCRTHFCKIYNIRSTDVWEADTTEVSEKMEF